MAKMTMTEALKKCGETMELAAQHFKDKGAVYTSDMHATAAGLAIRQVLFPKDGSEGVEPTSSNIGTLFHALYNHSAWRQKWEKAGYFKKKEERSAQSLMQELEEEFGEA